MPLTNTIHESLPYIDAEPTAPQRASAQRLIDAELGSLPTDLHPSIPVLLPSTLSPIMAAELERAARGEKLSAIDLSRYEALEPPSDSKDLSQWKSSLQQAYTSQSHLSTRLTNLSLLEKYGKNAWLIGNSQLEDILRGLERELEERKKEIDLLVVERKSAQESVGGEMKGYEEGWKRGVGRVLEVEVAAEGVRREILDRRRAGAV
ncbi:related to BCAS2 family protein [Phialocephala subalpina]|uniref:Related to BCAS2 family protein n=1 Tax=Phialocephala subalpina TaxID=576137 RepID=A0A1L7X5Z1_9HELO|nr:related to BCAS2 family protein [Phialocephala subalpina]